MHNLRIVQERNQSEETNAHCQLKQTNPIQLYFGSVIIFKLFLREGVCVYICTDTKNHGFFLFSKRKDNCVYKMQLINIFRPFSLGLGEQEGRKAEQSCSQEIPRS